MDRRAKNADQARPSENCINSGDAREPPMRPRILRNCTFVISAKVPDEEKAIGPDDDTGLAVITSPIVTTNFNPTAPTISPVKDAAVFFASCIVNVVFLKQGPPAGPV
jgi:hypothetical protein